MPGLSNEIVIGARDGSVVGPNVAKVHQQTLVTTPGARYLTVSDGQVQFHSVNRRYRVQFTSPRFVRDPDTGITLSQSPLYLQF